MTDVKNQNNAGEDSLVKNSFAALVALLFVLVTGYFAFNYLKDALNLSTPFGGNEDASSSIFKTDDSILSDKTIREDSTDAKDDSFGDLDSDTNNSSTTTNSNNTNAVYDYEAGVWVATDYSYGDITGNSHKVVSGDTLWEIAEARYGDGTQWTQIRDTNSDSIGYLPSGQQALIVPGQVLQLN